MKMSFRHFIEEIGYPASELTLKQFRKDMLLEDQVEFDNYLRNCIMDGITNAMCSKLCEVEPDGHCHHEYPSVLIEMNLV